MTIYIIFFQHKAIHAFIRAFDAPHITNKIEADSIYKIGNFYVDINKNEYKIVVHARKIIFAHNTVFIPITEDVLDIPFNKFWLIDFDELQTRVNINQVLSGNIQNINYYFHIILIYIFVFFIDNIIFLSYIRCNWCSYQSGIS